MDKLTGRLLYGVIVVYDHDNVHEDEFRWCAIFHDGTWLSRARSPKELGMYRDAKIMPKKYVHCNKIKL